MKLLILKTNSIMEPDDSDRYRESLCDGIMDGVIFLDGLVDYEVVEFDSATLDGEFITDESKLLERSKDDYLKRKYKALNDARKARIKTKG